MTVFPRLAASALVMAAIVGASGCRERDRLTFACGATRIAISTEQRMPGWAGGEENVYATLAGSGGPIVRVRIDNNGRWLDRLGASVAEDGSWIRLHVADARGAAAGRYRFSNIAFVDTRDGTLLRGTVAHSTDAERASLFVSSASLAERQTLRGRDVIWRPCQS